MEGYAVSEICFNCLIPYMVNPEEKPQTTLSFRQSPQQVPFTATFQNIANTWQAASFFNDSMLTTSSMLLSSQTTELSVSLAEIVILTSMLPLITISQVAKQPKLPIIFVKESVNGE